MIDPIQVRDYEEQDEDSDIDLEMRAIRAEEAADSSDEEKLEQGRAVSGRRSRSRSRRTALERLLLEGVTRRTVQRERNGSHFLEGTHNTHTSSDDDSTAYRDVDYIEPSTSEEESSENTLSGVDHSSSSGSTGTEDSLMETLGVEATSNEGENSDGQVISDSNWIVPDEEGNYFGYLGDEEEREEDEQSRRTRIASTRSRVRRRSPSGINRAMASLDLEASQGENLRRPMRRGGVSNRRGEPDLVLATPIAIPEDDDDNGDEEERTGRSAVTLTNESRRRAWFRGNRR